MDEPTVQIMQTSFFQTKKGKIALAVTIFVILAIVIIASLSFLPKKTIDPNGTPVKIALSSNYGFKAGNITLSCPTEGASCPSQELVNINNSSAVAYKAASGSSVINITKLPNLENIAVSEDKKTGKKYFYESVVKDQNSCYTIAYTLPDDAIFGAIMNSAILDTASKIAILGSKTFQVEGEDVSILIQVRNTPMDPGLPCSLLKKSPDFFKAFN